MANFVLGMNAKLYYGTAGVPAATEMANVRNVTLNLEAGEADVTTRANSGWRATAPTLRECSVELEMVLDPDDAGLTRQKAIPFIWGRGAVREAHQTTTEQRPS
ncbi:MAG: hypothetical protein IPM13_09095 [Phycisphaerales bacterium]|nr:hypothetical protein [Phycisphaerales bacterium]